LGGANVCGDITLQLASLAVGTYTAVLSDGQYQANAVFDNGRWAKASPTLREERSVIFRTATA